MVRTERETVARATQPGSRVVYNLGPLPQIPPGEGRQFAVGRQLVAVFHGRDGQLYATQASCPHRGGPLADGVVGGGQVVCPLHAFRFDLASGRPVGNDCQMLATHPVWITDGGSVMLEVNW